MPHYRYVLAASFSNLGAAIADRLLLGRYRCSVTHTRKVINLTAQLVPCAALAALALTSRGGSRDHAASVYDAAPSRAWVATLLCAASIAIGALTRHSTDEPHSLPTRIAGVRQA